MKKFKETEKILKRFLKSKIKITTATVVGFLIAGNIAFGENGKVTVPPITDINKDITITEDLTGDEGIVDVDYSATKEKENRTIINKGNLTGKIIIIKATVENDSLTIKNEGTIKGGITGIRVGSKATGKENNEINIYNAKNAIIEAQSMGIVVTSDREDTDSESIPGDIIIRGKVTIINDGYLDVKAAGISVSNNTNTYIENNGIIKAEKNRRSYRNSNNS